MEFLDQLTALIYNGATAPVTYLILAALIVGDALIPMLPSESLVIGLGSILVHERPLVLLALWLVTFVAAWVGDNLAYTVGQTRFISENRFMQRPRVQAVFAWARGQLERRGSTIIVVGRFIPVARIAINVTSGAVHFGRRRFLVITLVSSALWTTYAVLVGAFAGSWFESHPILGIVVAIGVGMVLGPVVDWILRHTILRGSMSAREAQRRAEHSETVDGDAAKVES